MTWFIVNADNPEGKKYNEGQLQKLLGDMSNSSFLQIPVQTSKQGPELSQVIYLLQDYFTKPDHPGYSIYQAVNGYLVKILTSVFDENHLVKLEFKEPYTPKELALLWTSYNMLGEILDWLAGKLREQTNQKASSPSTLRGLISIFIDAMGIIFSLRMREFTEKEIYGRILDDRQKWGFLLKDLNKQVLAQLMHVFMDFGSILYVASSEFEGFNTSKSLFNLPSTMDTFLNMKFIQQAYQGLLKYSHSSVSGGWIAWFIQELGFFNEKDIVPKDLKDISPFGIGIFGDIIAVLAMGSVFYNSNSE